MLIYTPKITSRKQFIFHLVLNELLGIEFKITSNAEEFQTFGGAKISYSETALGDEFFIKEAQLLNENTIKDQQANLVVNKWHDVPVFFTNSSIPNPQSPIPNPPIPNPHIPFDIFAASFYLVSRYEEYRGHSKDHHNRYMAEQSIAFKEGFLSKPIVNIWAKKFGELLSAKYPSLLIKKPCFDFIATYDIDSAYAYKERGFARTAGAYFKSLLSFDIKTIAERTAVLLGRRKDPFDTFEMLESLQKQYHYKQLFFLLMGDYSTYDKSISHRNSAFQGLIKKISAESEIGIHPSYLSNGDAAIIKKEVERLSQIAGFQIRKSRQHFLRLSFPQTYRTLMELNIDEDYTMGYASQAGFRAGICSPFHFYDLEKEEETHLTIYPFAVMDGTLKDYMKLSPDEAIENITNLVNEVKNVGGLFISLWHNSSFGSSGQWTGWERVYKHLISTVKNQ